MSSNDHTYETTAPWTDANADAAFAQSFAAPGADVDADEFIASNDDGIAAPGTDIDADEFIASDDIGT